MQRNEKWKLKLLDELKINLENTEDKSIYELDFSTILIVYFLLSKKEKHIIQFLYDRAKYLLKIVMNGHPNIIDTLFMVQSNLSDELETPEEYSLK